MTDKKEQKTNDNIALYTKYRPRKFEDVLGQDQVVNSLKSSIENNRISHAYIFSGGRGTGKTSIARIFANELGTTQNDLYEIDAASNTGVDNIRDLNESVSTLPFDSKYKIYILDEAHMLSKAAFNALLKTIEEPPKHIIFILATTEIHKIPDTVISRCETHTFKTPNREILKRMIVKTAKAENYELNLEVAELLAILGDGSFRDTHTVLNKVIRSSSDRKLTLEECEKVTGAPANILINQIIENFAEDKLEEVLNLINELNQKNINPNLFLKLFLEKIRAIILIKVSDDVPEYIRDNYTADNLDFLKERALKNPEKFSSKVLLEFIKTHNELNYATLPYLPIEMVFIDLMKGDLIRT